MKIPSYQGEALNQDHVDSLKRPMLLKLCISSRKSTFRVAEKSKKKRKLRRTECAFFCFPSFIILFIYPKLALHFSWHNFEYVFYCYFGRNSFYRLIIAINIFEGFEKCYVSSIKSEEQHVDARDSHIQKDKADPENLLELCESHNPFPNISIITSKQRKNWWRENKTWQYKT